MTDEWIESYLKAGKAVIAAKKLAEKLIKPGVSFLEIANKCEDEILNQGCELSFPINMSLNELAAHYSPTIDDPTVVPNKGLLKIDLGSHHNGYIADKASTFNIDNDPKLQNYIDAAQEALDAAIDIFKPGTKLYELGEVIADKIHNRGLRPISNLGGHELKQYQLHAGPFLPNIRDLNHKEVLKPGDAYACEPFATSGEGLVSNGKKSYIYRFVKRVKKNLPYEEINYMKKIEDLTKNLPFSPRLLEKNNIIPKNKIQTIIESFKRKQILDHYPVLIEVTGAPVAQQEHTIIIDMDGNPIVTT
ncbi:MAG: type II methionyl aminopeptidase [Candidatus Lokiarchaeota archaeon]|jgi:methionyl aminopeptidase|nr:type II methionyl aminopeptidase [Candidatus Lokiarchaeota archaeon]